MLVVWLTLTAQSHDYLLAAPAGDPEGARVVYGIVAHARARKARGERPDTLTRLDRVVGDEVVEVPPAPVGWGEVVPSRSQVTAVVYENSGAEVTLEWAKFRAYVADEGDPRVLDVVDALPRDPQREHYRRSIKLLLGVDGGLPGWDAVVGQPLELVPLDRPGQTTSMRVRLLASGEPVVGAKVRAYPYGRHTEKHAVSAITDAQGIATLSLDRADRDWVYAAVVMTHDPTRDVPWNSLWTSLRTR